MEIKTTASPYEVHLRGRERAYGPFVTIGEARNAAADLKSDNPDRRVTIWQGFEKVEES